MRIWSFLNDKADLTVSAVYNSSREDFDPVTFNLFHLGGYATVNVAASYKLTRNVEWYGRIDNLLDRKYEEVAGYGTSRFAVVYTGLRFSFREMTKGRFAHACHGWMAHWPYRPFCKKRGKRFIVGRFGADISTGGFGARMIDAGNAGK